MKNQTKIFKDIKGYEGLYQVNQLGEVLSLQRYKPNGQIVKEKIKVQSDNGNGYKTISLWKNGAGVAVYVHRLVASTFISDIPKGMDINHINGIKEDNNLSNLEIVTRSENIRHAFKTELRKSPLGKHCSRSKSGYSNISIKQSRGKSFFTVCIRADGKRFERRFSDLNEALVIHNQYMRETNKPHLIHSIKQAI